MGEQRLTKDSTSSRQRIQTAESAGAAAGLRGTGESPDQVRTAMSSEEWDGLLRRTLVSKTDVKINPI